MTTRSELIDIAACEFAQDPGEYGAFIAGAEWADENRPLEELGEWGLLKAEIKILKEELEELRMKVMRLEK